MTGRREREAGRRFGIGFGALAVAASGMAWARGAASAATLLGLLAAGCTLLVIGLVGPARLAGAAGRWMAFSEVVAKLGNTVVLGLVFLLVVTPLALALRLTRHDPLDRRVPRRSSYWRPYPARQMDRRHYERMA